MTDLRAQSLTRPTNRLLADTSGDWREAASCAGVDPDLFFVPSADDGHEGTRGRRDRINAAKAICRQCPVVAECLKWAQETNDQFAILGNTTPEERALHRKSNRAAALRTTILDLNRRGLSIEQIAGQTNVSAETVMRHMRLARKSGEFDEVAR